MQSETDSCSCPNALIDRHSGESMSDGHPIADDGGELSDDPPIVTKPPRRARTSVIQPVANSLGESSFKQPEARKEREPLSHDKKVPPVDLASEAVLLARNLFWSCCPCKWSAGTLGFPHKITS